MTGIKRLRERADGYVRDGREVDASTLRDIADQIERETLPRPLFEDGTPVEVGSEIVAPHGDACGIGARVVGFKIITLHDSPGGVWAMRLKPGQVVKRPEPPDTWERLTAEVKACDGSACQYFKKDHDPKNHSCEGCKAAESGKDCMVQALRDMLRRAKRLAGVEA